MTTPTFSSIFSLTTKRVTDLVLEESRSVFRRTGVRLDAKMTSIITSIAQAGPLSSTQLASKTGLSRQLVESRLRRLVADGYLAPRQDPADLRKRVYEITEENTEDVARVLGTTADFEAVYESIWSEIGTDLQQGLRDLETCLLAKPLLTRLAELDPEYARYIGQGDDRD